MNTDRILATYEIETPWPVEQAAEAIAGEQSSGTFVPVPGETEELKERSRARVETLVELEPAPGPSLPGSRPPKGHSGPVVYRRAELVLSFPYANVGPNLPTLFATVAGNLFELSQISGLKLLDLELPRQFAARYAGPQFGIDGTRKLSGVFHRPLIGTIIKPSVGLSPDQTAGLVRLLGEAGIDFIKDDELMADPPHSPFKERVKAVMAVINDLAERQGRKIMFAFNITDEIDAMLDHHDTVLNAGGTCVMVSINSAGFTGVSHLRRHCQLPIHGHRNGWGMFTRHPALGIAFPAYQKLWRLCGVDHLHVNGLQNKFWEPDDSVVASIKACQSPLFGGYPVMPVVSSGQWGGQAPETYRLTGTTDLIYVAGGGIMAHPDGPAAGLKALQQAWQAAVQHTPLEEFAQSHPELRATIEKFGPR